MKQLLYISSSLASEAVHSKERLEALAFAVCVKRTFVSSYIKNATTRRCKDIFGIGSTRMCRIIRNGLEYGYLRRDGDSLVALPVRGEKEFNIRIESELMTFSRTRRAECQYRLKDIADAIRKAALLYHISKQTSCVDTTKKARGVYGYKPMRNALRKIKSMRCSGEAYEGLSNRRVMNIVGTGLNKARNLVRNLVSDKSVVKHERYAKTALKAKDFSIEENDVAAKFGLNGFMFPKNGNVYLRLSNAYEYVGDSIVYVR